MKKFFINSAILLGFALPTFAGGIVTNTNQSAAWVRTMVRDASISVDAVYYNPAGLTHLKDGFYIEVNNQSIFQTKTINNQYAPLNNGEYIGDVKAMVFPSAYAVYKKGNLAVHGGFAIVGGGGSAEYKTGLPSFEKDIAGIPAGLSAANIPTTAYTADIYFAGTSAYMGIQLGASYRINDNISVGLAGRYISAKNTYEGHIRDIMINPSFAGAGFTGSMVSANTFFKTMNTYLTGVSQSATGGASQMQSLIDGGAGSLTFAQAEAMNIITHEQRLQMEGGLLQLGQGQLTQTQIDGMNLLQAQGTYTGFATTYATKANKMGANAVATENVEVDAEQTGTSFTPIIGLDLSLLEGNLGIALKYEHKTALELKNKTTADSVGMFPDGEKVPAEMPALLTVGIRYNFMDNFRTQVGFHYYMDKAAKYGKVDYATGDYVTNGEEVTLPDGTKGAYLDKNSFELGVSLEYDVAKNISLSGGYLYASTSPTLAYQTDMGYTLVSQTIGFGAIGHITENLDINIGASYTSYSDGEKTFNYSDPASATGGTISVKELYDKKTTIFAIGVGYRFGK